MAKKTQPTDKTSQIVVLDKQTGIRSEMSKFGYDQVRFEVYNGKPRYEVKEGTPNPLPQGKK